MSAPAVQIRSAVPADLDQLAQMCHALWPDGTPAEHASELVEILGGRWRGVLPLAIAVAEAADGRLVGFVEMGLRSVVDGCDFRRPVGYVEGWYVSEEFRRRRIGGRLIETAEAWARDHGCTEMGSDALLDNTVSQHAHQALGFTETDRTVMYRKTL